MIQTYIIKLTSSIEIITRLEFTNPNNNIFDQDIILSKPLVIGVNEQGSISFFPYSLSNSMCSTIIMNGKNIESYINEIDIDESFKKEYLEKTSTIQLI